MISTIFSKLQGWRKILNLVFSLNHDDNLPLSLKCIAYTSDAIFWCGTLAPLYPVVQPMKDVFFLGGGRDDKAFPRCRLSESERGAIFQRLWLHFLYKHNFLNRPVRRRRIASDLREGRGRNDKLNLLPWRITFYDSKTDYMRRPLTSLNEVGSVCPDSDLISAQQRQP